MSESISKNESLALRGLCISMIVLHNFIHVFAPYTENEKSFDPVNADFFINNIFDHPILGFFSYLGWLGVPMFFFLSGYGLHKKYGNVVPNKFSFIKWHYIKLLLLAGPIIILSNVLVKTPILHTLGQLTLLNNIYEYNWIRPASFWFIRCAFEFYILYAIIFHRIHPKLLLGLAFVITCSFYLLDWPVVNLLKYHHIGWILDFSLGIYVARYHQCMKYIENVYASIILFILMIFSSVNEQTWMFSTVISILFFLSIKRYITFKPIVFIGTVSAFLYATHTAVRNVWEHLDTSIDYMNDNVLLIMLSICGYFLMSVLVAIVYGKCYDKVLSLIRRKK